MASKGVKYYQTTPSNNDLTNTGLQIDGSVATVSSMDDRVRDIMTDLRADLNVRSGVIAAGGSSNAYTYSTTSAGYQTAWAAYAHGDVVCFEANHTNTGAATLNVDSLGAKDLRDEAGNALPAGALQSGGIYKFVYDTNSGFFRALSPLSAPGYSGTYSPTLTGSTNVTSVIISGAWKYLRVGNIVHVAGRATLDPTSTGSTSFRATLPFASNFDSVDDAVGHVSRIKSGGGVEPGIVQASSADDAAVISVDASDATSTVLYISFTYEII